MSTTISITNDNSHQITQDQDSELGWSLLGKAMGYPEAWISIVKRRLAADGRSWRWKLTNATSGSLLLQPAPEEAKGRLQEGGHVLLIINKITPMDRVGEALSLAEDANAKITVIYTSKPPLVDDLQTPGEVDQKFTLELEKGRSILSLIAANAKSLGVDAEISFVWAKSAKALVRQHDFHADLVIDETA